MSSASASRASWRGCRDGDETGGLICSIGVVSGACWRPLPRVPASQLTVLPRALVQVTSTSCPLSSGFEWTIIRLPLSCSMWAMATRW